MKLAELKVAFFQKVRFVFLNLQKKYSKKLSWAWNLNDGACMVRKADATVLYILYILLAYPWRRNSSFRLSIKFQFVSFMQFFQLLCCHLKILQISCEKKLFPQRLTFFVTYVRQKDIHFWLVVSVHYQFSICWQNIPDFLFTWQSFVIDKNTNWE